MARRHDKYEVMNDNKSEWNMALFFLQRLDERLNDRDVSFNNNDLFGCYRVLRTIYANIHFFLKQEGQEEEESKLEELFLKAKTAFRNLSSGNREIQKLESINFELLLDEITIVLYDLIFEYHLIFPKKDVKNPARALEQFS